MLGFADAEQTANGVGGDIEREGEEGQRDDPQCGLLPLGRRPADRMTLM